MCRVVFGVDWERGIERKSESERDQEGARASERERAGHTPDKGVGRGAHVCAVVVQQPQGRRHLSSVQDLGFSSQGSGCTGGRRHQRGCRV